jgi:hypothetical protein
MKILQICAAVMLMSVAGIVDAETTNRFVNLQTPPGVIDGIRDDANGRLIVGITDQSNTGSGNGRWVVFDLNFSRLHCLGPFDAAAGDYFYALYINEHRLLSFNTKCQYSIKGGIGGDFSTKLIFTEADLDALSGWLEDPVKDDIYVGVWLMSHEWYHGGTPPGGHGDATWLVLEGWLTD